MTDHTTVTCRQLVELVTDYVEGVADADVRAAIEGHLHCCDWCETYVRQYRETITVVRHIDPEGLDPRVEGHLLDVFRTWKAQGGSE
jgi:anti-sigma factor RsiW